MPSRHILIAGASGYIGRALIARLLKSDPDVQITALSRTKRESQDPRVEWRACDLFSLREIEEALPRAVVESPGTPLIAYYLVHSMLPTAHLDQGSFADYDLILADNFSRAMKKLGSVHLVYLGGIIPDAEVNGQELSPHLESRLEVEQVFSEHHLQRTIFRAGLIIGPHGSSFEILLHLVKRLPVMICPRWTQTLTTPIDLQSVVEALSQVVSVKATEAGNSVPPEERSYDLMGCQPLTYLEMMKETAHWLGLKRWFLPVRFFSPALSKLWVRTVSRRPKELVYPLIESLRHEMLPRPDHVYGIRSERTYAELLREFPNPEREHSKAVTFSPRRLRVRSVQRLPLPLGLTAVDVAHEYMHWLPIFMRPFVLVWKEGHRIVFSLLVRRFEILALTHSPERSSPDRQLLYITGGLLSGRDQRGRLEFREVLNRRYVLAAIHDFRPGLPWYVYQLTQAKVHLLVMRAFYWHLKFMNHRRRRRHRREERTATKALATGPGPGPGKTKPPGPVKPQGPVVRTNTEPQ